MDSINTEDIKLKLDEYTAFLREVLHPDLEALLMSEQAIRNEISEYEDLHARLKNLGNGALLSVVDVDLGHQKVFCRATIEDASRAYVHVGLGFHAELTMEEALIFVVNRIDFLSRQVLPHRSLKCKEVLAHVHSSERILDELSSELRRNC